MHNKKKTYKYAFNEAMVNNGLTSRGSLGGCVATISATHGHVHVGVGGTSHGRANGQCLVLHAYDVNDCD